MVFFVVAEHIGFMMKLHAEDDADGHHIADQGTSSITDEGQRNAGDRQELNRHADVLENVECHHGDNAGADIGAERVF